MHWNYSCSLSLRHWYVLFKQIFVIDSWCIACDITQRCQRTHWWSVNIDSVVIQGNGFGSSEGGNNPLHEAMLTILAKPQTTYGVTRPYWIDSLLTVFLWFLISYPDSKAHEANMGPTWVLSAPGGPHDGPINLVMRKKIYLMVLAWFRNYFSIVI